jgi:hypothetical protein
MLSESGIRRLRAWTALASLFIDNELGPGDYEHVAGTLTELGYTAGESEFLLRQEVAPVFAANLWVPAGEWTPWDKGDVYRIMNRNLPRSVLGRLSHRVMVRLARRQADAIWSVLGPLLRQ